MKEFASAVLLALILGAGASGETIGFHYSLLDNVREKLSHEKLDGSLVLGPPEKRSVPILDGSEFLMKFLAGEPRFVKDHIWGRLAHPHPFSTISFREEDSPSTHVLFRKLPDGSLSAEIHLDGNGPQTLFPHLDEFFLHKLTFHDNDQDRMRANLERAFAREENDHKKPFVTRRERIVLFAHETFGLEPLATAFTDGLFWHYTHELVWRTEPHYQPMTSHFEGSLFGYGMRNSVELGVASWRQEDTRYRVSGEQGFKKRFGAAVLTTFIVPTPAGREFAYARFAGIVGATAMVDEWHPWRVAGGTPNYVRQATFGLVIDPLARSMWSEFRPEILRYLPFPKVR